MYNECFTHMLTMLLHLCGYLNTQLKINKLIHGFV